MVHLFLNRFLDYLLSDLFDKQRHLAGNFRGVSGRLCWIFNFVCVSSWYLLVSSFSVAYCRAILFLRTGGNSICEYFPEYLALFFLCFSFLFEVVEL